LAWQHEFSGSVDKTWLQLQARGWWYC
jgi:hypothetical protein